jgi:hypothetical protein
MEKVIGMETYCSLEGRRHPSSPGSLPEDCKSYKTRDYDEISALQADGYSLKRVKKMIEERDPTVSEILDSSEVYESTRLTSFHIITVFLALFTISFLICISIHLCLTFDRLQGISGPKPPG